MALETWRAVRTLSAKLLRDAVVRACKAEDGRPVEAQLQYLCPPNVDGSREDKKEKREATQYRPHSLPRRMLLEISEQTIRQILRQT